MARDVASEARAAAIACDNIGCTSTAEALRALAAEFEALPARHSRAADNASASEKLSTIRAD